ncbi:hypothetical protein VTI28DRAFT_9228 [Corynascus sepedonium]
MKRRFGFGTADLEWLHPENFGSEPIYCEAPQNPDDIICHGSDDEAYDSPAERRLRYEAQAQRFLEGKPVFLLSASLRGPFEKKSGWLNPWRSKSDTRDKDRQKKTQRAPRTAAETVESNAVVDSRSFCRETSETRPTLPQHTHTPLRYMDDDTYNRVRCWRDKVVVESDYPTSSIQDSLQAESTSALSRKATQHTNRRRSGITLDTFDDEASDLTSNAPRVFNNGQQNSSPAISRRKGTRGMAGLPSKTRPDLTPSRLAASQNRPSSGLSPPPTSISDPTDLPPRTVLEHRQSSGESARRNRLSAAAPIVTDTTLPTSIPSEAPLITKTPATNVPMETGNPTPNSALLETAAPSGPPPAQVTPRTDGSFRYQRMDVQGNKSSLRKGRLANAPLAFGSATEDEDSGGQTLLERPAEDVGGSHLQSPGMFPASAAITKRAGNVEDHEAAVEATEHQTTKDEFHIDASIVVAHEYPEQDDNQIQNQIEEEHLVETPSQIDGPTLVQTESPSGSQHASLPSFGHFSAEKQSQDVISEVIGFPRRLLWPKSRRSTQEDSFPMLGVESTYTQESVDSGHAFEYARSVSASRSGLPNEPVDTPRGDEAVYQTAEKDAEPFNNVESLGVGEVCMVEAEPTVGTADPDTGRKVENHALNDVEQVQIEAYASSSHGHPSPNNLQPASSCPVPHNQSPWANDESGLRFRSQSLRPQHEGGSEDADSRVTPPRTAQSPWTTTADVVPGAPGIQTSFPCSESANAKLSFIASQALEQAVSQSPWARGDSQMQLPEVRLFNPLSSPANSHVLPAIDPLHRSDVPCSDDADMCNSQLYPPQPSTPETKQSGLPSPDFTLSVKSFKNFMTPSPAKRRRVSTIMNGEHLPNSQSLVDAVISNPWAKPSTAKSKMLRSKSVRSQHQEARSPKRVSWAPLPGEPTPDSADATSTSPYDAELPVRTQTPSSPTLPSLRKRRKMKSGLARRPFRAASPPPPSTLSASALPSTSQKFARHFAAVAAAGGRSSRRGTGVVSGALATSRPLQHTMTTTTAGVRRFLPSSSQQVCGSPAVEAMAEAFLRAEAPGGSGDVAERGEEGEGVRMEPERMEGVLDSEYTGGGEEEVEEAGYFSEAKGDWEEDGASGLADEEALVDEVSAVMENLDDFLGVNWDLDADLAKARTEHTRESREHDAVGSRGANLSGLLAVNAWD